LKFNKKEIKVCCCCVNEGNIGYIVENRLKNLVNNLGKRFKNKCSIGVAKMASGRKSYRF